MAIVSVVERADVSASRRFGEAPKFQRKWVVEVDDPRRRRLLSSTPVACVS
jgi:hypothetical protein